MQCLTGSWAEVLLLLWSEDVSPCYHAIDLFSGVGNIAKCYRAAGLSAAEYDFIHDPSAMDFLTPAGFSYLG